MKRALNAVRSRRFQGHLGITSRCNAIRPFVSAAASGGPPVAAPQSVPPAPPFSPSRAEEYDQVIDKHLTALSALGSRALQQRRAGVVPLEAYDDGGKTLSTPIAAAVDAAGNLSTATAAASLGASAEASSNSAPPWTTLTGLFIRESFILLSTQLVKAVLPASVIEAKDPVLASVTINEKVRRGDGLAALAMGLAYCDGLGKFPKDRQKAREIMTRLQQQLPRFPWPKLCYALLLLLEAQERAFFRKAGCDLSAASSDLRQHADCVAAVSLLTSCWQENKLAPVPMILARCHLYGIGTGPSSASPPGPTGSVPSPQWNALTWLAQGAAAGDPYCCAEVARFLLWAKQSTDAAKRVGDSSAAGASTSSAATTAASEEEAMTVTDEDGAIFACLRYAAVCDHAWARQCLIEQYRKAGKEERAKMWEKSAVDGSVGGAAAAGAGAGASEGAAAGGTSARPGSLPPPAPMTLLSGLTAAANVASAAGRR